MSIEPTTLRDLATAAAEAGGRAALPHFRTTGLAVERKDDDSPVTVADREAEAAIRQLVLGTRPEDGWLGEETGVGEGSSGFTWIVDPIDGTRNFVRGIPLWATLVACEHRGEVVAAAVHLPALGERYDAVRGGGARCDGEPIAVSPVSELAQALWCYETPGGFHERGLGGVFETLCRQTGLQRGLGDAYGHMLVASGRAELVIEPALSVWDVAATSLVVREAGGRFSDLDGDPGIRSGHAVISNGPLHQPALALLAEHRNRE